jgi:hypothetical protein
MKNFSALSAAAALALVTGSAMGAAFAPNGLAVIQAGDGASLTNNSVYSVLELTKATGQAAPVQTIGISSQVTNPMWTSATATSTAYLSSSHDRSALVFSGHTSRGAAAAPFPNVNTVLPRAVATLNVNGDYAQNIAYTGNSGSQTRSGLVFSSGTNAIDQAGLYASGGIAPALAGNFRNGRIFGGTGYVLQQSTTVTNIVISSVGGTIAAPTITGLPGLTNNGQAQDFYMLDSTGGGTFDLLYISTNTSATAGGILKFNLVGGSWVARGSATLSVGLFGLAAEILPTGGVALYATSGSGATATNSVLGFTDFAGAADAINLSASSTLYTTPTGTTLKGIDFTPIPAPGSLALLGLGGLVAVRRKRA